MYKLYKCGIGNANTGVMRIDTDSVTSIPFDEANTDYQEYLKWLAEGNQPLQPDNNQ